MNKTTSNDNETWSDPKPFEWQATYVVDLAYGIVMFFILTIGFFGNGLTLMALWHPQQRKKAVTPLMMNLAIADIFIIVFGYPVIITSNLGGEHLQENSPQCMWSGFLNGTTGIASIATLAAISGVIHHVIKQTVPRPTIPSRYMLCLVGGTWLYGLVLILPSFLGWSRNVPGKAGFSCAPDWTSSDFSSVMYVVYLITFGFFIPLMAISVFHYLIYRIIKEAKQSLPDNAALQAKRIKSQIKLVRMTAVCISAFVLSWSPYCIVSLAGTIKGSHVLSSGEAEIPELMAKASVIYNPLVYTFMNGSFRATLWGIVNGKGTAKETTNPTVNTPQQNGLPIKISNRYCEGSPV